MINKEAATEASTSGVSYEQISRRNLIIGIVDSTQFDFIIIKYLFDLSLF